MDSYNYELFLTICKNNAARHRKAYTIQEVRLKDGVCFLKGTSAMCDIESLVTRIMYKQDMWLTNPSKLKNWSKFKEDTKDVKVLPNDRIVYGVTAWCQSIDDNDECGNAELVAVCSTLDKANRAKALVQQWLEKEGFVKDNVEIIKCPMDELNLTMWSNLKKQKL